MSDDLPPPTPLPRAAQAPYPAHPAPHPHPPATPAQERLEKPRAAEPASGPSLRTVALIGGAVAVVGLIWSFARRPEPAGKTAGRKPGKGGKARPKPSRPKKPKGATAD